MNIVQLPYPVASNIDFVFVLSEHRLNISHLVKQQYKNELMKFSYVHDYCGSILWLDTVIWSSVLDRDFPSKNHISFSQLRISFFQDNKL